MKIADNVTATRSYRRSSLNGWRSSKKFGKWQIRRSYERSTAFGLHCKQGTLNARERIDGLRKSIETDTALAREVIRQRKDADDVENELKAFERSKLKKYQDAAMDDFMNEIAREKKTAKQNKPALPVGVASLDDLKDEVENPELVAELLGVDVSKVNEI